MLRGDGTIVWARITLSSAYDGADGKYLIGTAEDITEQKQIREELIETRRRVSSTLIAGEIATYEWDVRSDRLWGDANFDLIFGTQRGTVETGADYEKTRFRRWRSPRTRAPTIAPTRWRRDSRRTWPSPRKQGN